jgi:hypothetical protein
MSKNNIKTWGLCLATLILFSCNPRMIITPVADLNDEVLNAAVTSKGDVFLVKNYKDDSEHNDELYNYSKKRWLKYSATFKKYKVEFYKESKFINLKSIREVNTFNELFIDSLNHSTILKYQFTNGTAIIEKLREGQVTSSLKKKI